MNNKMAKNTYLPTIDSENKLSKENRDRIVDTESFDGCQVEGWYVGEWVKR